MSNATTLYDQDKIKRAGLVLRALNHNLRHKMLEYILKKGRVSVTELYIHLRIDQSKASNQLAILKKAGVVTTEREGKYIFHSVDVNRIKEIESLATGVIQN